MRVLCSIVNVKFKLEYKGMKSMSIVHAQKHIGGTYHMLNLRTKNIVPIRNVIWLNKTYSEYVSRKTIPR